MTNNRRNIFFVLLGGGSPCGLQTCRGALDAYVTALSYARGYYPHFLSLEDCFRSEPQAPGLWAQVLAHQARQIRLTPQVTEFSYGNEEAFFSAISATNDDYFMISCTSSQTAGASRCIASLRTHFPKAAIVLGGPHCKHTVDRLGIGEDVLIYRCDADTNLPEILSEADALVGRATDYPEKSAITYGYDWELFIQCAGSVALRMPRMLSSRYCPHRCRFCVPRGSRKGYDLSTWTSTVARNEISQYLALSGQETVHIRFSDPDFFCDPSHAHNMLTVLDDLPVTWDCQTRVPPRHADFDRLCNRMRSSGCRSVFFGQESLDSSVLDMCNKTTARNDPNAAIRTARANGLSVHTQFIVGLPGQSSTSVERDISWAEEMIDAGVLSSADVQFLKLYPGTVFAANPRRYGFTINKDFRYVDIEASVQHETEHMSHRLIEDAYQNAVERLAKAHREAVPLALYAELDKVIGTVE